MLTVRNGKEYFYLTSEVIEEETALTYKQQVKAIKDLEEAGYIEAVIMGSPARKYFHITDKITKQLLPKDNSSSDKKEELIETNEQGNTVIEQSVDFVSYDKREIQACNKGESKPVQKGQAYKEIKEKEKLKNTKNNFVNKNDGNKDEIIYKLTNEFRLKGMSKELCLRVLDEVNANPNVENFQAYLRTCLDNTLYKSKLKQGEIEFSFEKGNNNVLFYNWLEEVE